MEKNSVLIVEDESLIAHDIAGILRKADYGICAIVDNGHAALEAVKTKSPDLVIMDICIEGAIDGVETAKRIKRYRDLPIVFLSAYSDDATLHQAISTTPAAYLVKPFDRRDILAAVKLALFKSGLSVPGEVQNHHQPLGRGVVLDSNSGQIFKDGAHVRLSKNEQRLFELLFAAKGRTVPYETVEFEVWPEKTVSETTRRTLIHRLKGKLEGVDIQTYGGIGCFMRLPE